MKVKICHVINERGVRYIVRPVGIRYWFGDYALCKWALYGKYPE